MKKLEYAVLVVMFVVVIVCTYNIRTHVPYHDDGQYGQTP